jgi:hypothetical protein
MVLSREIACLVPMYEVCFTKLEKKEQIWNLGYISSLFTGYF